MSRALKILLGLAMFVALGCAVGAVLQFVQIMTDLPNSRRQVDKERAACEAYICQDGRHARMVAPRYESTLCACKVNP